MNHNSEINSQNDEAVKGCRIEQCNSFTADANHLYRIALSVKAMVLDGLPINDCRYGGCLEK